MTVLAAIGWKLVDRIGPVSPHGLGIAMGYVAGGTLSARRAERLYGIKRDHIWNALMWAVLGVIVGARLFYVAGHLGDYFPDDPLGIFRVWEGGIVFYGGAIGGIVAGVPYLRRHGIPFWHGMESIAPGFPLGLLIGRLGDLVIGDHLGSRTDFFLGYRYEGGALPPGCSVPGVDPSAHVVCPGMGEVVHQTALYDWLSVLVLFPVVLWLGRHRRPDGFLFAFMVTWYAAGRMVSDFARPAATYAGLRGTQWVSVALIAFGIIRMIQVGGRALEPLPAAAEPGTPTAADESPRAARPDEDAAAAEMMAEGGPVYRPPRQEPDGDER